MSLKGAENFTLHGKDGKKYVVTEMYYSKTSDRVFEVYYTDETTTKPILIWKYSDDWTPVPFDTDTCQLVIEVDDTNKKFDIKVYKNYGTETQQDITRSLDTCNICAYLMNDIFPQNSIFGFYGGSQSSPVGMKIPNETVPDVEHFYPLTITSGVLGKYELAASEAYSKVSGQAAPKIGSVVSQMDLPYSLTENTSVGANNLWVKIVAPYDMEVGKLSFPVADVNAGQGYVQLLTEHGVGCFYGFFAGTPSVETRTVNGTDYNYVVYDVSALNDKKGALKFVHNDTYYLKAFFNPYGKTNYHFARNSKMLAEVAYSTNVGDYTGESYDLSSYIDYGVASTEQELVQIPLNYFAKYTGDSHTFTKNNVYLNKTSATPIAGTTDDYSTIYRSKDLDAVYYYTGSNNYTYEFYQYNFYKVINILNVEDESDINKVASLSLDTKFYWTGETITDVLKKGYYYKVSKTLSNFKGNFIGTSTGLPDYTTLSVGDTFIGVSWYDGHYSGVNGTGVYTVTNVTDTLITVTKEAPSVYFTDVTTETIKSTYSNITTSLKNGMTSLSYKDMSNVTDNTDCGYEILLTAKT